MSGVSYEKEDADTRMVIRAGTLLALVTLFIKVVVERRSRHELATRQAEGGRS